jgi:hypothetical protein
MDDKLNGRRVIIWRDTDPYADLNALVTAIVESDADLYNQNGALVWLTGGKLVPVSGAVLGEIIRTFVVTKGVRNVGTSDAPVYERRFVPFETSEMTTRILIQRDALLGRVPKIDSANAGPAELPRWARQEMQNRRG